MAPRRKKTSPVKKQTVKAKAKATAQEELDRRLFAAPALADPAAPEVLSDDAAEELRSQQHAAASSSGPAAEAPAAAMGGGVTEGAAEGVASLQQCVRDSIGASCRRRPGMTRISLL